MLLKISNVGTGVRVVETDKTWEVSTPPMFHSKGSCTISLVSGSVLGYNSADWDIVSKLWVESNIPINGASTETTAIAMGAAAVHELFDVDLSSTPVYNAGARVGYAVRFRAQPVTFECAALPHVIRFRILYRSSATALAVAFSDGFPISLTAYNPQVNFILSISFNEVEDLM